MPGKKLSQDQADILDHKVYKLSEEQIQLLDNIEAQVWYIIKPDICGFVNKARADFFGKDKAYFQGRMLQDYLNNEESEIAIAENKNVFHSKQKIFTESHIRNKDGELRFLSVIKMPKLDSEGNVEYIICLGQDITNQKLKIVPQLKDSDKNARIILNAIQDEIVLIDLEGIIVDANQKAVMLSGKSLHKLVGSKMIEILPSKIIECINLQKRELINNKKSIIFEIEREGSSFDVCMHPIIEMDGTILNILISFHDITIRKLSEKLLIDSKNSYALALEQANFYKDLFIHDVFNIFNVINMGAELLRNQESPLDETVDLIKKAITRGTKLIENIQKLSNLDQEKITIIKIDLKSVLQDVCQFILNSFRDRSLKIQINASTQDYSVKANNLLYDVFENILINAIKHNIKEEIEITIEISKIVDLNKNFVKLEFKDNGFGISDDQKKIIFSKVNNKENTSGMGIGLSLVKKIVDNYGGKIWVEDRIKGNRSQGCNFILMIPEFSQSKNF
ncbi:MAG: PAS domain-containing sensor histidine kinase [Candidatus Lokiarchaeota archaeon]|nr:PAS domain-containing sensor histidine kinase [Candidatus Lokiarchaeota archaeon]